jgi:hypothetical protein
MADLRKATRLQVPKLLGHDERSTPNHTNEDIDPTRSHLNYNLAGGDPLSRYQRRIGEVYVLDRKNVNTLAMVSVTLPKDVKPEDQELFFQVVFDHFKNEFGEKNIVSGFVHLDEKTPHLHVKAIPVYYNQTKQRDQVSYDEVCPRAFYRRLHTDLEKVVEKALGYPCGILNGATKEGNKSIAELKRGTAVEELREITLKRDEVITVLESYEPKIAASDVETVKMPFRKNEYVPKRAFEALLSEKATADGALKLEKDKNKRLENDLEAIRGDFERYKGLDMAKELERAVKGWKTAINELERLKLEFSELKTRYKALEESQKFFITAFASLKNAFSQFLDRIYERTQEDVEDLVPDELADLLEKTENLQR